MGALLLVPAWGAQRGSAWPHEGSFVQYDLTSSASTPDGSYRQASGATLTLTFHAGQWSGSCVGHTTETVAGTTTASDWSTASGGHPAFAPEGLHRGSTVTPVLLEEDAIAPGCRQHGEPVVVVGRDQQATGVLDAHGRAVQRNAWVAHEPAVASTYQDVMVAWDQRTGLALGWSHQGNGGSFAGSLVDTDAFR